MIMLKSDIEKPKYAAVLLPMSELLESIAPCSDAYPYSSTSRCCGSMADASAIDTAKEDASNSWADCTKPACRTRLRTSSPMPDLTTFASTEMISHRDGGTWLTTSCPVSDIWRYSCEVVMPPGSSALAAEMRTSFATRSSRWVSASEAQPAEGLLSSSKYAASCRTVGASNIRLLVSSTPSPTAACS